MVQGSGNNYITKSLITLNQNMVTDKIWHFLVSETDEEEMYSSGESDRRKKKKKIFSLGYFSQLMNRHKIYSDDFDVNSDK